MVLLVADDMVALRALVGDADMIAVDVVIQTPLAFSHITALFAEQRRCVGVSQLFVPG